MFNKFVLFFLILVLSSCSSGRDYKKLFSNAMTIESLITSKDYQKNIKFLGQIRFRHFSAALGQSQFG